VARSSGDKTTKGARLLIEKSIREEDLYVNIYMTHYTRLFVILVAKKERML
jgi:hypothetical protein